MPLNGCTGHRTTVDAEPAERAEKRVSAVSANSALIVRDGSLTRAQLTVAVAVREVQHEADHQPPEESLPRRIRQAVHDEQAARGGQHTDDPGKRDAERTRTLGLLVAQHQHTDADEDEGEQRADVG